MDNQTLRYTDNVFKVSFDDEQGNEVSLDLLLSTMTQMKDLIREVSYSLDDGSEVIINAKPPEVGSFIIGFEIIELLKNSPQLLTKENASIAGGIISTIVGLYQFKEFLLGKKIKDVKEKDGVVAVSTDKEDQKVVDAAVYDIYKGSIVVQDALAKSFENIKKDEKVKSFKILDRKNTPLVEIKKSRLTGEVSESGFEPPESKPDKVEPTEAYLTVIRPSFDDALKWNFNYRGNKIMAKITDDKFLASVRNKREAFRSGDRLNVILEIRKRYDPAIGTYFIKGYEVSKVKKRVDKSDQTALDLEEENY